MTSEAPTPLSIVIAELLKLCRDPQFQMRRQELERQQKIREAINKQAGEKCKSG